MGGAIMVVLAIWLRKHRTETSLSRAVAIATSLSDNLNGQAGERVFHKESYVQGLRHIMSVPIRRDACHRSKMLELADKSASNDT